MLIVAQTKIVLTFTHNFYWKNKPSSKHSERYTNCGHVS